MKTLLHLLFGKGTRAVQVINLSTNVVWFGLLLLTVCTVNQVKIPYGFITDIWFVIILTGLANIFSIISFFSKYDKRQVLKSAGLIFGSLIQAIIASNYVSQYPPFDPMVIVCSILSTWFLLAVMYIAFVEGLHTYVESD